ncbi:MAG: hypothetical protein MSA93_10335 [Spirochaetales bacterium]|nr:hypothetical protein [Spirochaetales bacterium]
MIDKIFKASTILLGVLLLLLIVLTAVVGAEEITLRIIGWITVVPLISSVVTFIMIRTKK